VTRLRVVSPYRPFEPESPAHRLLGPFDWPAALRMLHASVTRQGADFRAITDTATMLPVPTIHLATTATRLMLWILDVSLRYLESDAFDRDTVMVSPDSLVLGDLRPYFAGDLSLLVRSGKKYQKRPLLNAVQWWPIAAKAALIDFYRAACVHAAGLPDNLIRWGADTEALRVLVEPIALGVHVRHGLRVHMIEARSVMQSSTQTHRPTVPIVDFKYLQKLTMAAYFDAVLPVGAR
jgi:hypothetical protein